VPSISPYLVIAVTTVLAYLIGGLPFGYWFVRLSSGEDIRTMGSGNIGATNVYRAVGRKQGLIVLFFDILKGYAAVWLTAMLTHGDETAMAVGAIAVMLGHCYPIFLGFKGGKAVACFVGAFFYLAPLALAITAVIFVAVIALSKYVSLGSIIGALVFPLIVWVTHAPASILAASIAGAALIVYRHKSNIARLRTGKENVFSLKRKTVG
jgi:acyl phosphate:glycerol-3-phosphate acyltransferase